MTGTGQSRRTAVHWLNARSHAQFQSPDGNINTGTFGLVTGAAPARSGQLALKFYF